VLTRWPIRNKLLIGIGLLLVIVGTLGWSGFHGMYAYRSLVRSLSGRAAELPLAAKLSEQASALRITIRELRGAYEVAVENPRPLDKTLFRKQFDDELTSVHKTLAGYRHELEGNDQGDLSINDSHQEWQITHKIEQRLAAIEKLSQGASWLDSDGQLEAIDAQLEQLQALAGELPSHLYQGIRHLIDQVRSRYRAWIILWWVTSISAAIMFVVFMRLFYTWVFRPLRILVEGSRRVAAGEFSYRIGLRTHDEMSELADALNDMTARFEAIRDDLDRQVQERTKQVVRSEQLASVGFLAAGVAHEINNPLASIAMCAESLESRVQELLDEMPVADSARQDVICTYLRMIQNEAFRCKGITERLLDFARIGEVKRQSTDLRSLVQSVLDMVVHLDRYHDKQVEIAPGPAVVAPANPQEIKQVVLNLITNALDSLSPGGKVQVQVRQTGAFAELSFIDNGCGMTDEVRQHLFEPFFTRRRTGQGIGLGLSITYRIIADHDGRIEADSDGPGRGSQFRVFLPLAESQKEPAHRYQAA
jgi:two-component system, NtrC family, sensor kinase